MNKKIFIDRSCHELSNDHQFNGIDIVKLICVLLVCMIHVDPFGGEALQAGDINIPDLIFRQCLCRLAVPFFFTASGFLLFRKTDLKDPDCGRIKNYCFKMLRLFGTWTLLLFVGGSFHLWYLGALVVAVIILTLLLKTRIPLRYIFIISLVLFLIGLLGEPYYGLIEPLKQFSVTNMIISGYEALFNTTRNGVFFGLIFVFLGALFAKKRIVMNNTAAVIGFIASTAVLFLEVLLLKQYSHPKGFDMSAALLPTIFFLFYIATHLELKNSPIYGSLRAVGMLIYFLHPLIHSFVRAAASAAKSYIGSDLSAFTFVITIVISAAVAVIIERLSKKDKTTWLKYLFS